MEIERTLQALLRIWHELPRLVGSELADVYPKLREVLLKIIHCDDSLERDWLVVDLLDTLEPYPVVGHRIDEVRNLPSRVRHSAVDPPPGDDPDPEWERDLCPGIRHRLDPPLTTRYTDVTAPRRLPQGKRGAVAVGLTREASAYSENALPVTLRLDLDIDVHLLAVSPGVEVIGERVKKLGVEEGRDAEPVVFYVLGTAPGTSVLRIDFRQAAQTIGTVTLRIEICAEDKPEAQQDIPPVALTTGGTYTPPADLEFRVLLHEEGRHARLHYVLHSPNGVADFFKLELAGPQISDSAESYWKNLLATLGQKDRADDEPLGAEVVQRRLRSIGERIFDDLLPEELRKRLRQIHASPARVLQIISDEPWIPWELLRPEAEDPVAATSWCERFELARWLIGRQVPAGEIRIRRLACVEAADAVEKDLLPGAVEDRRYLSSVSAETEIEDLSVASASLDDVGALLDRGEIDLWHFSGHPSPQGAQSEADGIRLLQQTTLLPADFDRERRRRIAARRPLVFLNVAGAGRQHWKLAGLAGWVEVWIRGSHCGAFLAPLYAIDDQLAHLFSRTFYEAVRRGETVGRAALEARRIVQGKSPESSAWMAYSVYAHPNARVVFQPGE